VFKILPDPKKECLNYVVDVFENRNGGSVEWTGNFREEELTPVYIVTHTKQTLYYISNVSYSEMFSK